MNLIDQYIEGLKNAYISLGKEEEWNNFVNNRKKLEDSDLAKLNNSGISKSLIELLKYTNGTDLDSFVFLGSDIEGLGYFLESTSEMFTPNRFMRELFIDMHKKNPLSIDNKIVPLNANESWIHFANCINNGGTSQLFLDLAPSKFGTKGQVIRYRAEPEEFKVIASTFDIYLQNIIDNKFNFMK